MLKNLMILAIASTVVVGIGYAEQSRPATNIVVQVAKTSPANGEQMYSSYCASCHGVDGKGNGPMTSSLVQRPADLTTLRKNNGGTFPSTHIISVLQFGAKAPAHGTAEMPVWGPVFGQMNPSTPQKDVVALRVSNLTRYIESLQVK
jgi:mono/diheme cytochrome c family protein